MPYKNHQDKLACQKRYRDKHKEQLRAADKIYAKKHPDKSRERSKQYNQRHPELVAARQAKWYAENKELKCAKAREWYANNLEHRQRYEVQYYKMNKARKQAYQVQYLRAHPWYGTMKMRNRRALKASVGGKWTHQDIEEQYAIQNGRCFYCCRLIDRKMIEADHIVPLSKGGTNYRHNLALACKPCNCGKKDKSCIEFAIRMLR